MALLFSGNGEQVTARYDTKLSVIAVVPDSINVLSGFTWACLARVNTPSLEGTEPVLGPSQYRKITTWRTATSLREQRIRTVC